MVLRSSTAAEPAAANKLSLQSRKLTASATLQICSPAGQSQTALVSSGLAAVWREEESPRKTFLSPETLAHQTLRSNRHTEPTAENNSGPSSRAPLAACPEPQPLGSGIEGARAGLHDSRRPSASPRGRSPVLPQEAEGPCAPWPLCATSYDGLWSWQAGSPH